MRLWPHPRPAPPVPPPPGQPSFSCLRNLLITPPICPTPPHPLAACRGLQERGMQQDLSWEHAAELYEDVLLQAKFQW